MDRQRRGNRVPKQRLARAQTCLGLHDMPRIEEREDDDAVRSKEPRTHAPQISTSRLHYARYHYCHCCYFKGKGKICKVKRGFFWLAKGRMIVGDRALEHVL